MANSMNDFDRMRREAQRRVEQSRRDSMRHSGRDNIKVPDFITPRSTADSHQEKPPVPVKRPAQQSKPRGLLGLLDLKNMDMDADRSVILMLLALLSGKDNESDELLMLALMYIML